MRKETNQSDAQTEFVLCTSLQPFSLVVAFCWWLFVFPWCFSGGDAMCGDVASGVMWLDEVMWLVL